ncbi:MAG: IclR family transcriptional regulator [Rhodoglobus sp.]
MPQIPAARNTLAVLRYLATRSGPVRASTLARDLGLPRSSVYQLVRVMMDEGFVVHYPEDRAYGLSALVVEIGSASLQTERLGRLATPLMERLVAESPLPVVAHLAVLSGAEVTYVGKVQGARAPTTVSKVGVRLPAHLTATGRAMLAQLPAAQVRALYPSRDALIRRQGPGPSTLAELDRLLADTRARGWAVEVGDVTAEYGSVGAASIDLKGYPVAGVGVTFRAPGVDEGSYELLGASVRATADALGSRFTGRS